MDKKDIIKVFKDIVRDATRPEGSTTSDAPVKDIKNILREVASDAELPVMRRVVKKYREISWGGAPETIPETRHVEGFDRFSRPVDNTYWITDKMMRQVMEEHNLSPSAPLLHDQKLVYLRTREEYREDEVCPLRGDRPMHWNSEGGMDYLFGTVAVAVVRPDGRYNTLAKEGVPRRSSGWTIRASQTAVVKVIDNAFRGITEYELKLLKEKYALEIRMSVESLPSGLIPVYVFNKLQMHLSGMMLSGSVVPVGYSSSAVGLMGTVALVKQRLGSEAFITSTGDLIHQDTFMFLDILSPGVQRGY